VRCTLRTGHDFFDHLDELGWPGRRCISPPIKMSASYYKQFPAAKRPEPEDQAFLAAARAAWAKFGPSIMAEWDEKREADKYPAALRRWGDPTKL
jgi:hypothetical protein